MNDEILTYVYYFDIYLLVETLMLKTFRVVYLILMTPIKEFHTFQHFSKINLIKRNLY